MGEKNLMKKKHDIEKEKKKTAAAESAAESAAADQNPTAASSSIGNDAKMLQERQTLHGDDLIELLIHSVSIPNDPNDQNKDGDSKEKKNNIQVTEKDVLNKRNMLIRTCSDVKMLWNRARGTDLMFMREASEKEDGSNGVESGFVKSHDQLRKLKINMNSMQENIRRREHLLSTSQHQQNIHQETDTVPTTLPTTLATSISSGLWGRIPSMPSMFGGSGTPSKNTTIELDEEKAQRKSNREEKEE